MLIASDERLFTALKYLAASYFCYIAWHSLRAKKPEAMSDESQVSSSVTGDILSPKKAFFTGFLINGLNVKATLFFVSLFSVIIIPETPFAIKLSYGLYMTVATAAWFVLLSYLLTQTNVRSLLQAKGYLLDRVMGAVLLLLVIQLVLSDLN